MRKNRIKLRVSPRRSEKPDPDAPFLVRWTADDIAKDFPRRFYNALKRVGEADDRAAKLRTLARCWTEEIEKIGYDPVVKTAVRKAIGTAPIPLHTLNEPPAKYSGKKGKKS